MSDRMTWCHKCRSKNRRIDSITGEFYQVRCVACGALGKPGSSIGAAIAHWNTQEFVEPVKKEEE